MNQQTCAGTRFGCRCPTGVLLVQVALCLLLTACGSSGSPAGLPAPTLGEPLVSATSVTLDWTAVDGADEYVVFWNLGTTLDTATASALVGIEDTTVIHAALTPGDTYVYAVAAVADGSVGQGSGEKSVTVPVGITEYLSITARNGSAVLTWTEVNGATSYNIYRSTTQGFDPALETPLTTTGGLTHTDPGLSNGTTYYYVVCAEGPDAEGLPSHEISARPKAGGDGPATATVSLTEPSRMVVMNWETVGGAEGNYNIYWGTSPGIDPATAEQEALGVKPPYLVHGLEESTAYYYVVTAMVPSTADPEVLEETDPSPEVGLFAMPSEASEGMPEGRVEEFWIRAHPGALELGWEPILGAQSYTLYRWTEGGAMGEMPYVEVFEETFMDESVGNGTTYYYVVCAKGTDHESKESLQVSGKPGGTYACEPTLLVRDATKELLVLSWDDTGAASFTIDWRAPALPEGENSGTLTDDASPLVHTGLTGGVHYYYTITAGGTSAEVGGMTSGGSGGEAPVEEGLGANSSVPILFAHPYGLAGEPIQDDPGLLPWQRTGTGLRPRAGEIVHDTLVFPLFREEDLRDPLDLTAPVYEQRLPSTWQAFWDIYPAAATEPLDVKILWGGRLAPKVIKSRSGVIRVECSAIFDLPEGETLDAYEMKKTQEFQQPGGGGELILENFGTTTGTYEVSEMIVFSPNARLKIQKLADDAVTPVGPIFFEGTLAQSYESGGGPLHFGSEMKAPGNFVYGYVWNLSQSDLSESEWSGYWRITISFDPVATWTVGEVDPDTGEYTTETHSVVNNLNITGVAIGEGTENWDPPDSPNSASIVVNVR